MIRAKRDGGTWAYNLVASGDLKLRNVVWNYPGKGNTSSGWGTVTQSVVRPEKRFRLTWTSPPAIARRANTGNFKVTVKGKRICPRGAGGGRGGGGGEETFEVSWDADVIGIKIKRGTTDLIAPQPNPQSVKVGEVINLTTELEGAPANAAVTLPQWTISGIFYRRWAGTGTAPERAELRANATQFYWVDGGQNREVSYAATINGERLPAVRATFNVDRPSYRFTVTPTGTIALEIDTGYPNADNDLILHYGVPFTVIPGVIFGTDPPRPADNLDNPVIRVAQLATNLNRQRRTGNTWEAWSIPTDYSCRSRRFSECYTCYCSGGSRNKRLSFVESGHLQWKLCSYSSTSMNHFTVIPIRTLQ